MNSCTFLYSEKEEIVNADEKIIVTEKQEMDQVPSSQVNKEGTVNEEEKQEDKVCIFVQILA